MHEKDKNKLQQEKKIDKAKSTNERKKKEKNVYFVLLLDKEDICR